MNYNPKIGHIGLVLVLGAESSAIFYYLGLARGENRGVDIGETRNEPVTVAYSDVDKDGYYDIIVQTRCDDYVFFGDGNNGFVEQDLRNSQRERQREQELTSRVKSLLNQQKGKR